MESYVADIEGSIASSLVNLSVNVEAVAVMFIDNNTGGNTTS